MDVHNECNTGLEGATAGRVVTLEGGLNLAQIQQARQAFAEAMRPGEETVMDLSAVTEADLSGLQLTCSAHRSYRKNRAVLKLRSIPDALRRTAELAGFEAHWSMCPYRKGGDCLWRD